MSKRVTFLVGAALLVGVVIGVAISGHRPVPELLLADNPILWSSSSRGTSFYSGAVTNDVLPPRWGLGDTWRVDTGVRSCTEYMMRQSAMVVDAGDAALDVENGLVQYTVTAIPTEADDYYVVEGISDNGPPFLLRFASRPFAPYAADVDGRRVWQRRTGESGPIALQDVCGVNLSFPYLPQLDAGDGSSELWHRVLEFGQPPVTKMRIQRETEGVWFVIWEDHALGRSHPVVFHWRYGDPWWDTMMEICPAAEGAPSLCRWGWLVRGSVRRANGPRP